MRIGIEFLTTTKIVNGVSVYTGGTNYAIALLKILINDKRRTEKIILILPNEFVAGIEDRDIFYNSRFELIYSDVFTSEILQKIDILFMPQVNGSALKLISSIKKKKRDIKIFATLHDRQHNIYRFDPYDKYYYSGLKGVGIILFATYCMKKILFNIIFNREIGEIDKIFTVSNYSMQRLLHSKIKEIKWYLQNDINEDLSSSKSIYSDYVLFVSGGRCEKNLLRSLEAFCEFKRKVSTTTRFIITGVDLELKKNLLKSGLLDENVIESYVVFLPYVSRVELSTLYHNCKYVVFTSKGEGYGLPIREAMRHGKVVLAARSTSIPEVAGSVMHYVNEFSVNSICDGFLRLNNTDLLLALEKQVVKRHSILQKLAEIDTELFLNELFLDGGTI